MIATVTIAAVTDAGVKCLVQGDDLPFWLPRHNKAVQWSRPPEVGGSVSVRIESWLVQRHRQLRGVASQRSLIFHKPAAELGPAAHIEGSFPMAYDNNLTGALFKNDKRENDRHPLYKGSCEIGGKKFWISAWLKKSEKTGEKFMSLAFKPADAAPAQSERNSYADAKQGAERDEIPF